MRWSNNRSLEPFRRHDCFRTELFLEIMSLSEDNVEKIIRQGMKQGILPPKNSALNVQPKGAEG